MPIDTRGTASMRSAKTGGNTQPHWQDVPSQQLPSSMGFGIEPPSPSAAAWS
jgi:hypothetical protein